MNSMMRNYIISAGKKFSIAITGGGTAFIDGFLSPGGASSVFNGAVVPYSKEQFDKFAGSQKKYCSRQAALSLAIAALKLDDNDFGVGVACSLYSENQREGRVNRCHVVVISKDKVCHQESVFKIKNRKAQEKFASLVIVSAIAKFVSNVEKANFTSKVESSELISLYLDNRNTLVTIDRESGETSTVDKIVGGNIFCGSFNPYHDGHAAVAAETRKITGDKVSLELCINNADKSTIDIFELNDRIQEILNTVVTSEDIDCILVSNQGLFKDKLIKYESVKFIVGFDTIDRISNFKYYENFEFPDMILGLEHRDIGFMVFHRETSESDALCLGKALSKHCTFHSTDSKFQKISSSKIRDK